jgi:hypothetical protein
VTITILLDAELGVKLVDLDMAKLVGHDLTHILTTMRDTLGYLAPVTAKANMYNFRLALFKLMSDRQNNAGGCALVLLGKVACWCIQDEEGGRPAMGRG